MPDLPNIDFAGLGEFFSLLLIALSVFWGLNKALHHSKI